MAYYETNLVTISSMFDARWYSDDGTASAVNTDPAWAGHGQLAEGARRLLRRRQPPAVRRRVRATSGAREQDFQTGRVAMTIDGEWRTGASWRTPPDLNYVTAPFPVPDASADMYGMGQVGGTIIGIPKGAPHPEEAWLLVSCMATDTRRSSTWRTTVRNVPTTLEALSSPDLDVTPQFQTFLDIFANPDSHYKETLGDRAGRPGPDGVVHGEMAGRQGRPTCRPGSRTWPSRSTTSWRRQQAP